MGLLPGHGAVVLLKVSLGLFELGWVDAAAALDPGDGDRGVQHLVDDDPAEPEVAVP